MKRMKRMVAVLLTVLLTLQPMSAVMAEETEESGEGVVAESGMEAPGEPEESEKADGEEIEATVTEKETGTAAVTDPSVKAETDEPSEEDSIQPEEPAEEEIAPMDPIADGIAQAESESAAEDSNTSEDVDIIVDEAEAAPVLEETAGDPEESNPAARTGDIASGSYGNITWGISADGMLTVSGTGDYRNNSTGNVGSPWAEYAESIISAEIHAIGITDMAFMFANCSNLKEVTISDTASVTDMYAMFSGCTSLTSLDLSNLDTSNVNDMALMFNSCENLLYLNISSFNTSNVINMESMFMNCTSLEELDVSGFDTQNVVWMDGMFMNCASLEELDVSGFDTRNVIRMDGMFSWCRSLKSLDVSNFNTKNVIDMGGMFAECNTLTELDLSSFDTSNVESMAFMLGGCINIIEFDVSHFNTSNVTYMHNMFAGCHRITKLDVSNFDTRNVKTMSQMFYHCYNLVELDLRNFDTHNVTTMYGMFEECSSLTFLNMSGLDVSNVESTEAYDGFPTPMLRKCPNLKMIYVPQGLKVSTALPVSDRPDSWFDPNGNEITELPIGLSSSVLISRFPVAVKYIPYEVDFRGNVNNEDTTYTLESGSLPRGIWLSPEGVLSGIPLEAGTFQLSLKKRDSSTNSEESIHYTLLVRENSTANVDAMSDPGYELIEFVPDLYLGSLSAGGSHTLVSRGEYSEFVAVYLNGRKLTEGTEYTSASGSTRITIIDQTLIDEGTGTHTIGIEFRMADNTMRRAAQNYTVSEGKAPEQNNGGANNGGGNNNSDSVNAIAEDADGSILYVVQRGDTLWKLAVRYYGSGRHWVRIYQDNTDAIRSPHRLHIGQVLTIYLDDASDNVGDPLEGGGIYTVKSGDSLWQIARRYYGKGSLWQLIYQANRDKIANPGRIRVGQVFRVPSE